jgi:N-acetylneuraminic acid mutarotase
LKWLFLILTVSIFVACGDESEEELVGDWQRRAPFPRGARAHMASFVIGDMGYVCGGINGSSTTQRARKELFALDHKGGNGKGSWRQNLPIFPGRARQQAVGFSLKGKGYVGTGYDGDETDMKDFWCYDPATEQWDSIAPLPANAEARRAAIAFALTVNGKEYGYVGTGYTQEPEQNYMVDFWQFDPEGTTTGEKGETLHGKWTEVTGYGGGKRAGASVFVLDNKAYICLGKNSGGTITDFWVFDPALEDPWIIKNTMYDSNQDADFDDEYFHLGRSFAVAFTAVAEGGQLRGHIALGDGKSDVWEYDHDNDLWIKRTQFVNNLTSYSRAGAVAFSFPSTRAFVGMGTSGSSAYYDDLWEFIPMVEDYTHDDHQ